MPPKHILCGNLECTRRVLLLVLQQLHRTFATFCVKPDTFTFVVSSSSQARSSGLQTLKVQEFTDTLAVGALAPGLAAAPALKELQLNQLQPAGVAAVAQALGIRSDGASLQSLTLNSCR